MLIVPVALKLKKSSGVEALIGDFSREFPRVNARSNTLTASVTRPSIGARTT